MSEQKYIIGIDLGTTNCTLAYHAIREPKGLQQFSIPQVIGANTQGENPSLPSFVYFPLPEELSKQTCGIEWEIDRKICVGAYAKERGGELPSRVIASAKSWSCSSGLNRRQKFLPLHADEDADKLSPLDALAALLMHLKEAWNFKMDGPFEKQQVLITVPASFDPSARQLILEASELAGYPEALLLEEPQAAFYSWLEKHEKEWRKRLKVGDCVLVIDIGGGTTDFSLIGVEENGGDLELKRLSVGSHLLLGGDNMDLSLAHLAKLKFEEAGHVIDDRQLQALIPLCREAKEKLLSGEGKKSADIALMGRGSKLVGGTIKTQISQEEALKILVDGFVPLIKPEERSPVEKRSGIQQIGLPYALDARISCQLAKFLSMTGESDSQSMDRFVLPTAVLFNGGVLKAKALRDRFLELLNGWAKALNKAPITELPNPDLDYAVSRGAVYYGLARTGKGIRIKSGTSRSYYVGVEDAVPAIPGFPIPMKAYCVVPYGMEEGTEQTLDNLEFSLILGELASFRFFSRATPTLSNGDEATVGMAIRNYSKELTELHPIEIRLEKNESDGKTVQVSLKSKITELGMLELWCVSSDGRKWKLEFCIREIEEPCPL